VSAGLRNLRERFMPTRAYFVTEKRGTGTLAGFRLSDARHVIADFVTESAALSSARALAQLDCSAGLSSAVYLVSRLGQVVLKWQCERQPPEIAADDYDAIVRNRWRRRTTVPP
jgi:hypothetical protein